MDDNGNARESESSSVFTDSETPIINRKLVINLKSQCGGEESPSFNEGLLQMNDIVYNVPTFRRKGIKYSRSMVENFALWLGVDNSSKEVDRWKEHIRRRRTHNRLVGQYKEDPGDDIFDAACGLQTPSIALTTYRPPIIIDPYSKHTENRGGLKRQVSKISTSSLSKKMSRSFNPVNVGAKESVFKLVYNGLKDAITPTLVRDDVARSHHRSVAMLQIINEIPHVGASMGLEEDGCLDDVFFNEHTPDLIDSPDTVFPSKSNSLGTNMNNHNNKQESNFTGMSKVPQVYIAEAKGGRQIGVGFAAFLTEAEYRKSRLDSTIRRKISSLEDHRPYFTCWMTFVQVVCYIFMVFAYDLAPFGISAKIVTEEVLKPNLAIELSSHSEESNVWLGLRQADLIHMGAKYAGCMRRDETIGLYVEMDRADERRSGCCIRIDGSGCYQSSENNCSFPFGREARKSTITIWKTWMNGSGPFGRSSGSVCHQDPRFCSRPPTPLEQQDWPDDITRWPLCIEAYSLNDLPLDDTDHMTCDITGRPCCVGIKGQCIITTREDCAFKRGYYHQEASLCSQVACLEEVCGMIPFIDSNIPDQFYRLFLSLFIHAGVIHLLVTIIFQMTVMGDLEKLAGSLRIAIIYIFSGIAGSLMSAIFLPYVVEAGPSGSQFGLLACLFVEVIQNRYILKRPLAAVLKLSAVLVFLFLLGLMPMVDNFAHLGGFTFGFLLSFAFLPYITFNLTDKKTKMRLVVSCFVLSVTLLIVLFIIFYVAPIYDCSFCHYINCLPITDTFCKNMKLTTEMI